MLFEWDDEERSRVAQQRGIDFVRLAASLFDGRPVLTTLSARDGEDRFITIGALDGRTFVVMWTWRGPAIRLIRARRARDGEERTYRAVHG